MKLLTIVLLNVLVSTNGFAAKETFPKNEIVLPLGKQEIVKFLELLKDPTNQKVIDLKNEQISFQEIPQEDSSIFSIGSDSYLLYFDDLNNDGKKEYLLAYLNSGSGKYSGIQGSYNLQNNKVVSLNLENIIIKNLFPNGDMSRFHSYLAKPFVVRVNGKVYLRFQDQIPQRIYLHIFGIHQNLKKWNYSSLIKIRMSLNS